MKTAVEWLQMKMATSSTEEMVENINVWFEEAMVMEKEKQSKLWTNEEVFDMLYKTDKFLMIELREYWKTIKK